jgi:Protein of unknown function (DUF2948)
MLRLSAQDADDLMVISAQMQDAVLNMSDISFNAKRRQFALVGNRFAWDAMPAKQRRRTGLHFDAVLGVKRAGFAKVTNTTVLSLMSMSFEITDAPSGLVTLAFAGGQTIRLHVECLDAGLKDLGPAWSTDHKPTHKV